MFIIVNHLADHEERNKRIKLTIKTFIRVSSFFFLVNLKIYLTNSELSSRYTNLLEDKFDLNKLECSFTLVLWRRLARIWIDIN